jgi:hypothetical protein
VDGGSAVNRRSFLLAASSLAATAIATSRTAEQIATPSPGASPAAASDAVITRSEPQELADGLFVDYIRLAPASTFGWDFGRPAVALMGEMTSHLDEEVDAPYFRASLLDREGIIVADSGFDLVQRTMDPNVAIPFSVMIREADLANIDPAKTRFEIDFGDFGDTRLVSDRRGQILEVEEIRELSRADDDLVIEGIVRNAGTVAVEDGVWIKAAVHDAAGLYCGYAWDDPSGTLRPGDAARFHTKSAAGLINPLRIAGDDFTYKVFVDQLP